MKVGERHYRTIWVADDSWTVEVIDQTKLPFSFEVLPLSNLGDAADAIQRMVVRGAPLIGVTAAYGMALEMRRDASNRAIRDAYDTLFATRPTAVNLRWALDDMQRVLLATAEADRVEAAYKRAGELADDDADTCHNIGLNGAALIEAAAAKKQPGAPVNILTHCNAGWLATTDWGTALAPIYVAHDKGIPVHVWVDETRPRNQGASLTAWELHSHGVPHSLIVDNVGGHLMQHGQVDLCITGTDRTTGGGDVCNKIGTYLKALAAHDNGVPFYVALPYSTIDWTIDDGVRDVPIEERDPTEVTHMTGRTADGRIETVEIIPAGVQAVNYAFDVTPRHLVTQLITERGICEASRQGLETLYPEQRR
jgi:methylthioribose-1-phosphate isomerase